MRHQQHASMTKETSLRAVGVALVLAATALQGVVFCRDLPTAASIDEGGQPLTTAKGRNLQQTLYLWVDAVDALGNRVQYMAFKPVEKLSWRAAYTACSSAPAYLNQGHKMVLAFPTGITADQLIHQVAQDLGLAPKGGGWADGYWIGYNDIAAEGNFTWPYTVGLTGTSRDRQYPPWLDGEPNNWGTGEDCTMAVDFPGATGRPRWNDMPCNALLAGYVCQVILPTKSPSNPPGATTAPLPPMPGTGVQMFNGGLYSLVAPNTSTTWLAAKADCQASGTWLVKINSSAENTFVRSMAPNKRLWLGASDAVSEGTTEGNWRWTYDNSNLTYTKWSAGEPNNAGGNENYLMMWGWATGDWNDHNGAAEAAPYDKHYVCWVPSY